MLAISLLCLTILGAAAASAEEAKKDDTNATPAVKEALKSLFPEGVVKSLAREQKGKLRRYVAVITDKDGEHNLQLRADGSVLERSDPIKPEAIPAGILAVLKKKNEKGKTTAATKFTIRSKVTYEVEFEAEGKKEKLYYGEDGSQGQPVTVGKGEDEEKDK